MDRIAFDSHLPILKQDGNISRYYLIKSTKWRKVINSELDRCIYGGVRSNIRVPIWVPIESDSLSTWWDIPYSKPRLCISRLWNMTIMVYIIAIQFGCQNEEKTLASTLISLIPPELWNMAAFWYLTFLKVARSFNILRNYFGEIFSRKSVSKFIDK